jgi:hypothetical protein
LITNPILVFHSAYPDRSEVESIPGLISVWWDGSSPLLHGLLRASRPSELYIQDVLLDTASSTDLPKLQGRAWQAKPVSPRVREGRSLLVIPSSDTHMHMFEALLGLSDDLAFRVLALKEEGAREAMAVLGIEVDRIRSGDVGRHFGLLVANDWGPAEKYWVHRFRKIGTPTACLQESVIDFGGPARRMRWVDYPLLQGAASVEPLGRRIVFLTGNPRYEQLRPQAMPRRRKILINSNFTYGIHEEVRDSWLESVVSACTSERCDYLIAQHPRDQADLAKYNRIRSNSGNVQQLLVEHDILVTRFSSLIHEALALGRPVIYFNPHQETMLYDFEPDGFHLRLVNEAGQLPGAIASALADPSLPDSDPFFEEYCWRHLGSSDGKASTRVAAAMELMRTLPADIGDPLPIKGRLASSDYLRWQVRSIGRKLRSVIRSS